MAQKKSTTMATKPVQIKMAEKVHELLKRRARDMGMTLGELIQNMLSSFEQRIEEHKVQQGVDTNFGDDQLNAKLFKALLLKDARKLNEQDVALKIEKYIKQYQEALSRPEFTALNDDDE